jgi:hypothetical protein
VGCFSTIRRVLLASRSSEKMKKNLTLFALLLSTSTFAQDAVSNGVPKALPAKDPFYLALLPKPESGEFRPLTQKERIQVSLSSTYSAATLFNEATSAAFSHWLDSPHEWGQGMLGYSRRLGTNAAQDIIRSTLNLGISMALHEDNRYFASGKSGVWPRIAYALKSSVTARHDNGKQYISVSQLGSGLSTSIISRQWAPASWQGPGNITADFSIWLANVAGFNIAREFVPDLMRMVRHKKAKKEAALLSGSNVR